MALDPMERFRGLTEREGQCLRWTGSTGGSKGRYGYFRPGTRVTDPKFLAHRWIYEQVIGPIPDGWNVDHVRERGCQVGPLCVEPFHLEAVPPWLNAERTRLKTCRAGKHDLTDPANVRWDGQGRRRGCIVCQREQASERYYRRGESHSLRV